MQPILHRLHNYLMPPDWAERLQLWLSLALQLAILAVLAGALLEAQWLVAFTAAGILTLTFLPAMIERQLDVHLPVEFTLVTCAFLYAAFGLGEIRGFYERYWWWDLLLHSVSALVMGLAGFLLVYVFYTTRRIRMAPLYVALVSFGFAMTIGSLWELFEYAMDWTFGLNMQKSGLQDTMTDLLVDMFGGLLAAWGGYHYVKDGDTLIVDRLVRRFIHKNPRLFARQSLRR